MQALETKRLGLRPFTWGDLDFLTELNADPDVARYIGYGVPRTREETCDMLERVLTAYEEDDVGHLAVCLRATGALIGRCGLSLIEVEAEPAPGRPPQWFWFRGSAPKAMPVADEIEIGYTFAKAHWGLGYATESATAVRDFAFQSRGVERLVAAIFPGNLGSKNVARKLGLKRTGHITAFGLPAERHEMSKREWLHRP